jgi:4-hydroxythreonine-4-phosphate dehydrogenase
MAFISPKLRVSLATVHIPLGTVPSALSVQGVLHTLRTSALAARAWFGLEEPRLALCGVNPHAGERGHLGREDAEVLAPAVERARSEGISVEGPLPADTLFPQAARGRFDWVVACYHDQGLIPVKLLGFGEAVNITLGLPIVRTSVDHGVAYDIAGKGVADASSMGAALDLAIKLSQVRRERGGNLAGSPIEGAGSTGAGSTD